MGQQSSKDRFAAIEAPPAYAEKAEIRDGAFLSKVEKGSGDSSLTDSVLDRSSNGFKKEPRFLLSQAALSQKSVQESLLSRTATLGVRHEFNHKLQLEGNTTNQKSSGRCWLFAATNCMRLSFMNKYNLSEFELSQSYLFFWDKLEKSNYFLEKMIDLVDEDFDARLVQHLLEDPVSDGGQWDMIVNVVSKYGVVPKAIFPETYASSASSHLNWMVTSKLREYTTVLRRLKASGKTMSDLRDAKSTMVDEIYKILAVMLGEPPKSFDYEFHDKNGKFIELKGLTPLSFYTDHVGYDVSSLVSLVNDPRHPYFTKMTVDYLKNVTEGKDVTYVNLPIQYLKGLAIDTLVANKPVWFGCDVGKFFHSGTGVMDLGVYEYDLAFGVKFGMSKAERLQYGESAMTHAMVFTGVHLDDAQKPVRWRVENSWGTTTGDNGFEVMSDDWFSEYTFQVVVDKAILPPEVLEVLEKKEAIVLPPWDPMGTLA